MPAPRETATGRARISSLLRDEKARVLRLSRPPITVRRRSSAPAAGRAARDRSVLILAEREVREGMEEEGEAEAGERVSLPAARCSML
jgi:hypothetical protein